MAAQSGILYADLRSVPRAVIETLSRDNEQLGPDGAGVHAAAGVALSTFAHHFDRLALRERQPVRTRDGAVCTWDGRLDNRDDFLIRLRREQSGDDHDTDARLIAEALAKWGEDVLGDALGDWSLVRWQPHARELRLASDYLANRPLHYISRPDFFAWSTAIEPLVDLCGLDGQVDDAFMASYLTQLPADGSTPYRDVRLVLPGHVLRVRPGEPPRSRPWTRPAARTIQYGDAREYAAHYRHVFTDAVRVRLRARAPVWSELSGGYDSSAITCIASDLMRAGAVEAPAIQPLSLDLSRTPESDESKYVRAVDEACGLHTEWFEFAGALGNRLPSMTVRPDPLDDAGAARDAGELSALPGDRVQASGSHVLLAGSAGDSVSEPIETRDLLFGHLRARRFGAFFSDSLAVARGKRAPIYEAWLPLWRLTLGLERRERQAWDDRFGVFAKERHLDTHDPARIFGLRADFLRRSLRPALSFAEGLDGLPPHAQHFLLSLRQTGSDGLLRADHRSLSAARMTFPFAHRPLIDFVLAVPPAVLWHPVRHRAFVCDALADVLPPLVLSRQSKGDGTSVNTRHLAPRVMGLLAAGTCRLVEHGYADAPVLRALFRAFLEGRESTTLNVKRLIAAETMLRQMTDGRRRGAARLATLPDVRFQTKGGECTCHTSHPSLRSSATHPT